MTNTACSGGGCGPNGLTLQNFQMNPGGGNGPACALKWGGFVNAPSSTVGAETRLSDVHIEWHASATGILCSDNTATTIQQVFMTHVETATAAIPLFALNAATGLVQWFVSDSFFGGCSDITLAPTPASGPSFSNVHFSRVFGCNSASFTSNGVGSNNLELSGNNWGTLTVAGSWNRLSSFNDVYTSLTDTASGNVSWANPVQQSWTPVLNFGGGNTGITYTTQFGNWLRNADGGYSAIFRIVLTSKGSSTGAATITGLPKQCSNGATSSAAAGVAASYTNMASLGTAPVLFYINSASTTLNLVTAAAAGQVNLADTNFTNTTILAGTVRCAQTL